MQQSVASNGCSLNLNLWIEIDLKTDKRAFLKKLTCSTNRSSCTNGQGAYQHPNTKAQIPQVVEDLYLQERLAVVEKNCSHFFELYRKYRLRWLEEIHHANILEKYAPPDVDCYTAAQMQWDAPSPFSPGEILDDDNTAPEGTDSVHQKSVVKK
ncbi:hypothetical protein DFH29DRAFT_870695 [Suillus ampliporus]|nr:hypothetical protein DFH29DRAFT_870695 [Suillus ampliporus]